MGAGAGKRDGSKLYSPQQALFTAAPILHSKRDSNKLVLAPSSELAAAAVELEAQAAAEASKIDESTKSVAVKLGDALVKKNIKIPEMVVAWAKRGEEPISKMEFRQHVRKLVDKPDAKQIDALFESLDEDHGGTLDVSELKAALKKLQDAARTNATEHAKIALRVDALRERAASVQAVADATARAEDLEVKLKEVDGKKPAGARLGLLLQRKSMKVGELVAKWDKTGSGQIQPSEFASNARALGLEADDQELDALFKMLDEDGSGTLDMIEMKHALRTLMDAAIEAEVSTASLKKTTAEALKAAKATQDEYRKAKKAIEKAEVESAERELREVAEKEYAAEQARAAKAAYVAEKKAAKAAEEAEFERKILARRGQSGKSLTA